MTDWPSRLSLTIRSRKGGPPRNPGGMRATTSSAHPRHQGSQSESIFDADSPEILENTEGSLALRSRCSLWLKLSAAGLDFQMMPVAGWRGTRTGGDCGAAGSGTFGRSVAPRDRKAGRSPIVMIVQRPAAAVALRIPSESIRLPVRWGAAQLIRIRRTARPRSHPRRAACRRSDRVLTQISPILWTPAARW